MQKRETTQTRRKEKEARRREGSPASDGARGSEGPVKEKRSLGLACRVRECFLSGTARGGDQLAAGSGMKRR